MARLKLSPPTQEAFEAMRIVVCHNFYQYAGGEDRVFEEETRLLAAHGHHVATFTKHNDAVEGMRPWALAARTIWNRQAARELEQLVRDERADVVHFHNTLPLISPAAYYAARRAGAAVVQTLHNFRLTCPKSTYFRDGRPCESCLGKLVPWPAVRHACYRDNRAATAAITAMLVVHRALGTYRRAVDAYIALSQFSRDKLIASGLPAEKIHLRPNFILENPGSGPGDGGYFLYVGRLSPEKGIETLLPAWRLDRSLPPLKIVGDGPMAPEVQAAADGDSRIEWLGQQPATEVNRILRSATALVMPSVCYETFGRAIAEAFAVGTPVVASRLGSMNELVDEGRTGWKFTAGDPLDLAAKVRRVATVEPGELSAIRRQARTVFAARFAPELNLARLLEIYAHAQRVRHGKASAECNTAADEPRSPRESSTLELEPQVCTR
jgi:glycosyltransferase involved in cell wall biosynthesis